MIKAYFDGSITVNPGGRASYGYLIYKDDALIDQEEKVIGEGFGMTNNVAEFAGLQNLLIKLNSSNYSGETIIVNGDSQYVINTLLKNWNCREHLRDYKRDCSNLIASIKRNNNLSINWIKRELNKADQISRSNGAKPYKYTIKEQGKQSNIIGMSLIVKLDNEQSKEIILTKAQTKKIYKLLKKKIDRFSL
jgi:ribonuclease HI